MMAGMPSVGESFGPYRIEGRLGNGAMGVVLRARHVDLDRPVALKLLMPHLTGSVKDAQRFRREATALARLDSAHVVQVYDAGERDGWLYIATQLIDGGDVTDLLEAVGGLAAAEALTIVGDVLRGLEDAHEIGLVHRDVKPSNVLLRRSSSSTRAYLCDLGISQTAGDEHTQTAGVLGTSGYLAPERAAGQPASVASDIYSVGCLMWALLAGEAPYLGTDLQVALGHQSSPIPQLTETSTAAESVNRVLARSMAKQPGARYQTAAEMLRAVMAAAADEGTASLVVQPAADPAGPPTAPVVEPPRPDPSAGDPPTPVRHASRSRHEPTRLKTAMPGPDDFALSEPATGAWPSAHVVGPGTTSGTRWTPRWAVAGLAAAAVVVVGLAIVAASLVERGDEGAAVAGDTGPEILGSSPVASPSPGAAASPSETGRPSSGPRRESRSGNGRGPARCWDGTRAAAVQECSTPRGKSGLEWVFPSMVSQECIEESPASGSVAAFACAAVLPGGEAVTIRYSQWESVTSAEAYYGPRMSSRADIANPVGETVLYRWLGQQGVEQVAAQVFADHPYSVAVYVGSAADRVPALTQLGLVRLRPATAITGVGPSE